MIALKRIKIEKVTLNELYVIKTLTNFLYCSGRKKNSDMINYSVTADPSVISYSGSNFPKQAGLSRQLLVSWLGHVDLFLCLFIYLFYLMANDGKPQHGVPSAGTSCNNMMAKGQQKQTQKKIH